MNKSNSSDDDSTVFDNASIPVTGAGQELIDRYTDRQRMRLIREIEWLKDVERSPSGRASAEEVSVAIARLENASSRRAEMRSAGKPNGLRRFVIFRVFSRLWDGDDEPFTKRSLVLLIALVVLVQVFLTWIFPGTHTKPSADTWSSLFAGVGAGVSGGALVMAVWGYVKARKEISGVDRRVATLDFARKIDSIETLARLAVSRKEDGVPVDAALGEILADLIGRGIWSEQDVTDYRLLLRIRNSVVHQDKLLISPEELLRLSMTADRLEDYLRENGTRSTNFPVDNPK